MNNKVTSDCWSREDDRGLLKQLLASTNGKDRAMSDSGRESQQPGRRRQRGRPEENLSSSEGSTSSWDEAEDDEVNQGNGGNPVATTASNRGAVYPQHFSFLEHQLESLAEEVDESVHNSNPRRNQQQQEDSSSPSAHNINTDSSSIPADQERQLLLLMLLGQVCALHDPTPRTFTVHVLELFERGILDRQSIHFLYDLGLVPSVSSPTNLFLPPSTTVPTDPTSASLNADDIGTGSSSSIPQQQQQQHHDERPSSSSLELAVVAAGPQKNNSSKPFLRQRSVEASAIRSKLEQQERRRLLQNSESTASDPGPARNVSWSAEHHPLSLSRYQREFNQVGLLASGSFGHVYRATNKMDSRDYAIKRVPFSETGYSRESVQQVVREVHCLAVCDHPHVVRYYTSWLEPSWMTGTCAGAAVADDSTEQQQKLLTDIDQMVQGQEPESLTGDLQAYFKDPGISRQRRRFSLGASFDASESSWGGDGDDDVSEWTTKDDSYLDRKWRPSSGRYREDDDDGNEEDTFERQRPQRNSTDRKSYRYQICLFIQMQLCHPATLADWIRERNGRVGTEPLDSRIGTAQEIFIQISRGLNHVHRKGIIHRDLKPANVFAASEDGIQFKIGDFGLSRLIQTAAQTDSCGARRRSSILLLEDQRRDASDAEGNASPFPEDANEWQDPLTAGVGTASYAAPEQVASRTYGKEADIFSVGLILLELLCCFSTEHERLQTFNDCRHRRKLPDELKEYPLAALTILGCTEPSANRRPSAEYLLSINILQDSHRERNESQSTPNVQGLQEQLSEKEREIQHYKEDLAEKDCTIDSLRAEVERLRSDHYDTKRDSYVSPVSLSHTFASDREGGANLEGLASSVSSGSSSEDGV
jgi:translation initiation factor 2-alpha kinase 1